jgi:hypothetical protein
LPKLLCHRQSATQRQQQPIPLVNQHVQWGAVAGAAAQSPVIEWRVWWTIKRVNRFRIISALAQPLIMRTDQRSNGSGSPSKYST